MNETATRLEQKIDAIELPLQLPTDTIERLGVLIDELRASRSSPEPSVEPSDAADLLGIAQSIYRLRRIRDDAFDNRIFADPAWDILLDLFIAAERGRRVSVSSACIGAAVPATTALRHLSALAKHGLVSRDSSESDFRVSWVALTPTGYQKMKDVLTSYAKGSP